MLVCSIQIQTGARCVHSHVSNVTFLLLVNSREMNVHAAFFSSGACGVHHTDMFSVMTNVSPAAVALISTSSMSVCHYKCLPLSL